MGVERCAPTTKPGRRGVRFHAIIFANSEAGTCARCDAKTEKGPIGWCVQVDQPICDACLIEVSPHLGMVLNVAFIFREVGGIEPDGDPIELVCQVLTLARIYESAAAKVWPSRKPGLIEFAKRWSDPGN